MAVGALSCGMVKMRERERVRRHTAPAVNRRIDDTMAATLQAYSDANPEEITARLADLDREWDVERVLETHAAVVALGGLGLGLMRDRRWLTLSVGVLGFLLLHATRGGCPPLQVLRRLGLRTRGEIDQERFALKFLRGDFAHVHDRAGHLSLPRLLDALAH